MKQPNEKQLYSNQNSMTNVEIYKMIFKNISWLHLCTRCPITTEGGKVLNQEPIIFFFFKPTWVTRNWGNLSWQFLVLTLLWFTKFLEKLNIVNLIILLLLSEALIVRYFDLMGLLWDGEGWGCSIQIEIQKINPVCSLLSAYFFRAASISISISISIQIWIQILNPVCSLLHPIFSEHHQLPWEGEIFTEYENKILN